MSSATPLDANVQWHALPEGAIRTNSAKRAWWRVNSPFMALDRMRHAGVVITSTEMVIYELLQRAGTNEFRAVLPLVK